MVTYAEARRLISQATLARSAVSSETIPLSKALNRVCASELFGREPIPPFDNSSMDGYALASSRAFGAGTAATLPVLGTILAGDAPRCRVEPGAWKIMTGAPIPAGCDAVVPLEQARELDGGRAVVISTSPHPCDYVRAAGQDFGAGAQVCPAGTRLEPRHLMALAAAGVSTLPARRKPRVALIATGRELVPPDRPLGPGQIRDASSTYLAAECERLGWDHEFHGVVADDAADFAALLERVLTKGYDVVLTTGAVSMGEADFIPETLKSMGAVTHFHKAAIKPGRPILFAEMPNGPFIFGLPGNPISSVVGMKFLVKPCLLDLLGQSQESPIRCRLSSTAAKPENLRCFFKARRSQRVCGEVEILPAQASFQIHSFLAADCWAVLPEEGSEMKAGAEVDVYEA